MEGRKGIVQIAFLLAVSAPLAFPVPLGKPASSDNEQLARIGFTSLVEMTARNDSIGTTSFPRSPTQFS